MWTYHFFLTVGVVIHQSIEGCLGSRRGTSGLLAGMVHSRYGTVVLLATPLINKGAEAIVGLPWAAGCHFCDAASITIFSLHTNTLPSSTFLGGDCCVALWHAAGLAVPICRRLSVGTISTFMTVWWGIEGRKAWVIHTAVFLDCVWTLCFQCGGRAFWWTGWIFFCCTWAAGITGTWWVDVSVPWDSAAIWNGLTCTPFIFDITRFD